MCNLSFDLKPLILRGIDLMFGIYYLLVYVYVYVYIIYTIYVLHTHVLQNNNLLLSQI